MKHLKKFDHNSYTDNYILASNTHFNGKLKDFIENNIGKIIIYGYSTHRVTYKNIPKDLLSYFYVDDYKNFYVVLALDEILEYSNNIEDLEDILVAKKYNL